VHFILVFAIQILWLNTSKGLVEIYLNKEVKWVPPGLFGSFFLINCLCLPALASLAVLLHVLSKVYHEVNLLARINFEKVLRGHF
jgi:hypothetical protein